ncbi:MAG: xylulose kinase [Marmoricola sp.]|nr:xylulose kinase [Marmoricola sp.]
MNGVLVGLDVGTTSAKAVATTADGKVLGAGRAPLTWHRSDFGVEIDAQQLVDASISALGMALENSGARDVIGLGVASMGESSVLLDSSGRPVAPVIAWHDVRDLDELEELDRQIGQKTFITETGLPFRTQWSLTKHRWQTRRDPRVAAATTRLGVAEWVVRSLGGEEVSEQSLASRTGWLKLHERAWWDEALAWSGLASQALPPLVGAGSPTGRVTRAEAPSALLGATLTVAGHDHQTAAVGAEATQVGTVLDSCGTAEALVRTIDPGLDRHAIAILAEAGITTGWHAEPGRWCLLGGTQGGLALRRVLALLGLDTGDIPRLDASPTAPTELVMGGVDDDTLTIAGVAEGAGPPELWHAALKAVTARSKRINAAMSEVAGPHARFVVTGGWAASTALMATKEEAFGPLELVGTPEAGARGAARFAGVAAGIHESVHESTRNVHDTRGGDSA